MHPHYPLKRSTGRIASESQKTVGINFPLDWHAFDLIGPFPALDKHCFRILILKLSPISRSYSHRKSLQDFGLFKISIEMPSLLCSPDMITTGIVPISKWFAQLGFFHIKISWLNQWWRGISVINRQSSSRKF